MVWRKYGKSYKFYKFKRWGWKNYYNSSIGEILAKEQRKKVLIIDLDPQTNATVMLIDQEVWKEANKNNKTINQMFLDKIEGTEAFDINDSIMKNVSNIGSGVEGLDLLPSSIDLIDINDEIGSINENSNILPILKNHLEKRDLEGRSVLDKYDYILIDCPPNLGTITMSGVYVSNYYIVPVLADTLSTYGLTQVVEKINKKSRVIKRIDKSYKIEPLGVLINRYKDSNPYKKIKLALEAESNIGNIPKLFNSLILNRSNFAISSDYNEDRSTIRKKYGENFSDFNNLVNEIKERCESFEE